MSPRRAKGGTTAEEVHQQPTANYWNSGNVPTWTGPLAYYNNDIHNDDMEGRFRTGLSLTGGPGFATPTSRQGATPMEDSLFEINQIGLSPMWRDPSPASAYIDPRVGRPAMQARPPLPFQYVTEAPSVAMSTNTTPASWGTPAVDVHSRGRGPASSTARQPPLYQTHSGQQSPQETIGTVTTVPTSPGYPAHQYAPYPPYPGPLTLPPGPLPGPTVYNPMQQEQPPVQASSPGPVLVQLGASHNFLVNNRPARYIQVLDVDPSYERARTPSPSRSPAKSIYVRAPETEVHYWAVFLRDLTIHELIKRVVQKYGFSDDERHRVKTAVRVLERNDGGGSVRLLKDDDVRGMEGEVAIDVKVSSLDDESEDWQLELRY